MISPSKRLLLRTLAREALLRELVASSMSRAELIAPLAALPGAPITKVSQVAHWMYALGLKLTDECRRASWAGALRSQSEPTYTEERRAYLAKAYPDGEPIRQILAALNAMPGPQIKNIAALGAYANKIGLKRSALPREVAEARKRERKRIHRAIYRARKAAGRPPKPALVKVARVRPAVRKAPAMRAPKPARPTAPPMRHRVYVAPAPVEALPPTIEPSPAIADAVTARKYDGARMDLSRRRADPAEVARKHGLPLREVFRLQMVLRMEARA